MQATITKIQTAPIAGQYAETSVDAAKAAADIIITGHARTRTEIISRKLFSGAGIKLESTNNGVGRYLVTEAALEELRRRFTVQTDF